MLLKDPLFISAKNQGVSFENVHVIDGNCLKPKMGLNENDLKILSKSITLVVHNAASLSFAARVKKSVQNNTTPTWNIYKMCCYDFSLHPSLIFISSLATNSHINQIPERLIPF